jgi:cytochrome P450
MIHLLARNPEALRLAREEVLRVVGDAVVPTLEQLAELDYVEACAHETMRLKPVAPMVAVGSNREVIVGDVRVPAGVQILGVMRHDTMDPRFFPDPTAFEPARWLAGGHPGQTASAARRVSMPFGAGPRMCPGRNLALMEMKMAMAMLLGRFEIDRVEPAGGGEVLERLAFTMAPVDLRMHLRERGATPA